MALQILIDELQNDPLERGYAGMTDEQAADDLNTVYRQINRDSLSGDEVFQATDAAEFNALNDGSGNQEDAKSWWISFCGRDSIDPFGSANIAFVQFIFGGGSTTISNLQALRLQDVSRAIELGLPFVKPGHVAEARSTFQ